MAIWQFSVSFIPRENLLNRFGEIPTTIDDEILWKEDLDEGVLLPDDYENYLSKLGEKEKLKWTPNSLNWGDYDDGTHITIGLEERDKVDVFARFHVGELDINFVQVVLDFAEMCECVLLTKNETIIEPQFPYF